VVAPQVFRISLRINPIVVILSLLIGFQLYGIAGALVALPVVAVLRETALYLRRHLVLEPWGTPTSLPVEALEDPAAPADAKDDAARDEPGRHRPRAVEVSEAGDEAELAAEPETLQETEPDTAAAGLRLREKH
jgi:hypothetical protein